MNLFGIIWIALLIKDVLSSKHEERLLEYLFTSYNPAARPVINDMNPVLVKFGMTLSQIVDVHEKSQTLVISVFIQQHWRNEILRWHPKDFNNISTINVDPKMVWLPDIVLYDNADDDKSFGGNLDKLNTRVQLESDGKAMWLSPIILKSQCSIDVKYFPFDTQFCPLKFGSWTYDLARLDFRNKTNGADLSKFSENSEWKLNSAFCERNEIEYPCCTEKYPDVTFTIVIARRSLFYLCNLIFPMTVIGMLTMLSFMLPAESGERISLAITLLLAMTVFMLVVADIIPATSDVIPLVGIFFSASMIEMVFMIVVLCYVLRLYHKGPEDPPMPLWMKRYIYDWLSYHVRIRQKKNDPAEETLKKNTLPLLYPYFNTKSETQGLINNNNNTTNNNNRSREVNLNLMSRFSKSYSFDIGRNMYTPAVFQNGKTTPQTPQRQFSFHQQPPPPSLQHNNNPFAVQPSEAQIIISKLEVLVNKLQSIDDEDEIKTEWRTVAMTLDRCLLVFFFVAYFITLVACFLKSPGYVP